MSDWTPPGDGAEVDPSTPGYTMTIARAAVALGVLPPKLAAWRKKHIGPRWRREGGQRNAAIYYSDTEVKAVRRALDAARASEPKAAVRGRIDKATNKAAPRSRGAKR